MEKKTSSFVRGTSISGRSPLPYGKRSDTLLEKRDGAACECIRDGGDRLIVSYSLARAANDAKNREKGVERLRKSYSSGMLTKANVNEHGYNKFLEIRGGDVEVSISQEMIAEDERWDGLKGYVTNTALRQRSSDNITGCGS